MEGKKNLSIASALRLDLVLTIANFLFVPSSQLIIVWIIGSIGSGKSKLAELLMTSMNWIVLETELAGASLIGLQTQHFNKNVSISKQDFTPIKFFIEVQ